MRFLKLSLCLVAVLSLMGTIAKEVSDHRKSEEIMLRSLFRVPPDAYDVRYWREDQGWFALFEASGVKFRLLRGEPDQRLKQLADEHGSGDHRRTAFCIEGPVITPTSSSTIRNGSVRGDLPAMMRRHD